MNNVQLSGRLVRDPSLKFIAKSGKAVATITIAVDKKMSREKKEEARAAGKPTADYIRCIAWGKQAETIANHFSKGKGITITAGSIATGSYKTNEGETRYTTDVNISDFEFPLSSGGSTGGGSESNDDFNFGNYNPDDFQVIEDDEDIPF